MATKFLIIFKKISPFLSHSRQRKDKICLNCDAEIYGRYCHICGQENVEPKESAWSLVTHFFYDITHFDGKFFSTVRYLLLKPGFLSNEYIKGRRARYLHPIRMYVFTSAFFFIVFFSLFSIKVKDTGITSPALFDSLSKGYGVTEAEMLKEATSKSDSDRISRAFRKYRIPLGGNDTATGKRLNKSISVQGVKYGSVAAYDSAQAKLPEAQRDGWYTRMKTEKLIQFKQGMNRDPEGFFRNWMDALLHKFPQLLFISLPIFALLLKLLYVRKKQFYYADHGIFTIHLYIFTFVALFILLMFNQLHKAVHWKAIRYLELGICLYMLFYTYKALRNFYRQGRIKTLVKFFLLNFLSFFMILFLFMLFFVLSIYEI
jgi:hypothetical protein